MKKGVFLAALAMMSWAMAGSAFAGPFGGRFGRVPHPQQRAIPQNDGRDNDGNADKDRNDKNGQPQQGAREGEMRQGGNPGQAQGPGQQFGGRNGARMSVEERQKLRRQINEAGRSLYTPSGNK